MKLNAKRGFTVVELVIVIAIIAILAGILIPVFSSIVQNSRKNSAWQEAQAEYLLYRLTKEGEPNGEVANDVLIEVHYDNDVFYFVALDKPDSVDQENRNKDNGLCYKNNTNILTGFSTEKNVNKRSSHNTFNIVGDDAGKAIDLSASIPDNLETVIIYELAHSDKVYNTVAVPDSSVVAGKEVGEEIEFGYYPQSDVTTSKGLQLEKLVGIRNSSGQLVTNADGSAKYLPKEGQDTLPIATSGNMWISYDYYDGSSPANYAWYLDVETNDKYPGTNKKIIYRAVYFVKYRPCYTGIGAFDSMEYKTDESCYQPGNGYYVNNIYWFKFEPIKWKIVDKDASGNYTIASIKILDAQQYQANSEMNPDRYQIVVTFNTNGRLRSDLKYITDTKIFASDWQESQIKTWLGTKDNVGDWMPQSRFANTAFSANDRDRILNTTLTTNGCWDYYKGSALYLWPKGASGTHYYGGLGTSHSLYKNGLTVGSINTSDLINYGKSAPTDTYSKYGGKALENNYIWLYSFQEIAASDIARWFNGIKEVGDTTAQVHSKYPEQVAQPTGYAMAQGAYCYTQARYDFLYQKWEKGEIEYEPDTEGLGNGTYWLRTNSGRTTFRVNFVGFNGTLGWVDSQNGNCADVKMSYLGVRPVTRITPN